MPVAVGLARTPGIPEGCQTVAVGPVDLRNRVEGRIDPGGVAEVCIRPDVGGEDGALASLRDALMRESAAGSIGVARRHRRLPSAIPPG